jgi:diaminohydroxyphosphoribosylaminopyrimidine deaminase/5-amino-6-(5-phosphoribosylamino)uracil reductase
VNLEPCNHTGHTPPCTRAILNAKIARVVIGVSDPNPDVAGGGADTLRANSVSVTEGVLETQCRELNAAFIHFITHKTPYVVMKIAATLDGKIATKTGSSQWITGERSLKKVHQLRGELDAVMVGIGTVLKDNPTLTCRLSRPPHQPLRIVADTHLRIPEASNLLKTLDAAPLLIVTSPDVDAKKRARLESKGVEILSVPLYNNKVDLRHFMAILAKRPVTSILMEGGARLNGAALEAGIVRKVMIFYAAKILGGQESLAMIGGSAPESLSEAIPVTSGKIWWMGNDFLFEGELAEPGDIARR